MKTSHLILALVLTGLLAGPLAACSSTPTRESTGEYVDNAAIANTVRAKLIGDKDLNIFQIDVTSFKGNVQLSGFVNSATAKARAGKVAASVRGVRRVHNNLIVK
jgi:osmotically-inducible protein OsmY